MKNTNILYNTDNPKLSDYMVNPYDVLSLEYYSESHKTSRNFDAATAALLEKWKSSLSGLVVELGAGRGRANEYLNADLQKVIQVDSSESMLSLEPRESALLQINCDARKTPFMSGTFGCAAAFLFDPFNDKAFFKEVGRILKPDGVFIGTLPAFEWGFSLRNKLGLSLDQTRFVTESNDVIFAPSLLSSDDDVIKRLQSEGFHNIEIRHAVLPTDTADISPDIQLASEGVGCSVFELPIVQVFKAYR